MFWRTLSKKTQVILAAVFLALLIGGIAMFFFVRGGKLSFKADIAGSNTVISGQIKDKYGSGIGNAEVAVVAMAAPSPRRESKAVTDSSGRYSINMPLPAIDVQNVILYMKASKEGYSEWRGEFDLGSVERPHDYDDRPDTNVELLRLAIDTDSTLPYSEAQEKCSTKIDSFDYPVTLHHPGDYISKDVKGVIFCARFDQPNFFNDTSALEKNADQINALVKATSLPYTPKIYLTDKINWLAADYGGFAQPISKEIILESSALGQLNAVAREFGSLVDWERGTNITSDLESYSYCALNKAGTTRHCMRSDSADFAFAASVARQKTVTGNAGKNRYEMFAEMFASQQAADANSNGLKFSSRERLKYAVSNVLFEGYSYKFGTNSNVIAPATQSQQNALMYLYKVVAESGKVDQFFAGSIAGWKYDEIKTGKFMDTALLPVKVVDGQDRPIVGVKIKNSSNTLLGETRTRKATGVFPDNSGDPIDTSGTVGLFNLPKHPTQVTLKLSLGEPGAPGFRETTWSGGLVAGSNPVQTIKFNVPMVETLDPSNITSTTITPSGRIVDNDGRTIERGYEYTTNTNSPSPERVSAYGSNFPTGQFSDPAQISGLKPSTIYYIRAYALNFEGTTKGLGSWKQFATAAANTSVQSPSLSSSPQATGVPTVETLQPVEITRNLIHPLGSLDVNGSKVIEHGFHYSLNPEYGYGTTKDQFPGGKDTASKGFYFTKDPGISSLTSGTTYYIRAFATNLSGTGLGQWISVPTLPAVSGVPTVETKAPTNLTMTTAVPQGNIKNIGTAAVTQIGFQYGLSQTPERSVFNSGNRATGNFTLSQSISGLVAGTRYYIRAYASNTSGTGFGPWLQFTTPLQNTAVPSVQTLTPTNITTGSVTPNGNISNGGDAPVVARGFQYGLSMSDSTASKTYDRGSFETGTYSKSPDIANLKPGTTYYIRAYATNRLGTGYGGWLHFPTLVQDATLARVDTLSPTNITTNSSSPQGNLVTTGDSPVTRLGFEYGLNIDSTTKIYDDGNFSAGPFTKSPDLAGLTPGSVYYIRAYAVSRLGTSYGSWLSFVTEGPYNGAPVVETIMPDKIGSSSIRPLGKTISHGFEKRYTRGFEYRPISGSVAGAKMYQETGDFGTYSIGGSFTATVPGEILTDLWPETDYEIRAFAYNQQGMSQGTWLRFTTLKDTSTQATTVTQTIPFVQTLAPTKITATSISPRGKITNTGNAKITRRGFQYGLNKIVYSTTYDSGNFSSGQFTKSPNISGLKPGKTYYIRAFVTNSKGTGYGAWQSFKTPKR